MDNLGIPTNNFCAFYITFWRRALGQIIICIPNRLFCAWSITPVLLSIKSCGVNTSNPSKELTQLVIIILNTQLTGISGITASRFLTYV